MSSFALRSAVYNLGRRQFVHEHPEKAKAWEMLELNELMMHPEIGSVVLHMCAFGMVAEDEKGEAPLKKGTRVMSSSGEALKLIDRRCSKGSARNHIDTYTSYRAEPRQRKCTLDIWQSASATALRHRKGLRHRASHPGM